MRVLSTSWPVSFGQFTLNGRLTSDALERAINGAASAHTVPSRPEKEVRIAAPCGLFDPSGPVVVHSFLGPDGSAWVGVGTREVTNAANPALVEARFRARAAEEFGDGWNFVKKRKLANLRRTVKAEMAASTPFRLGDAGAIFICLADGQTVVVGKSGIKVASDLVQRIPELTHVRFRGVVRDNRRSLLAILRRQEEEIIPWPNGTASLTRRRLEVNESASVRSLSWAANSQDAHDLLAQNWRPVKIELQWADGRKGSLDLTGGLCSVKWGRPIRAADPHSDVEDRLGMLLNMDGAVQILVRGTLGTPLPMGEDLPPEE